MRRAVDVEAAVKAPQVDVGRQQNRHDTLEDVTERGTAPPVGSYLAHRCKSGKANRGNSHMHNYVVAVFYVAMYTLLVSSCKGEHSRAHLRQGGVVQNVVLWR